MARYFRDEKEYTQDERVTTENIGSYVNLEKKHRIALYRKFIAPQGSAGFLVN